MKKRSAQRKFILAAVSVFTPLAAIWGHHLYTARPGYGLPFQPLFESKAEDRWAALGGTWEVIDGSMRNDSNDRGAKLLTGSPHWEDYVVEGDMQLLGAGSTGILARVSEAEVGENSFKGYWAGVRTGDNSLVLGTFDFAYHEAAKVVLPQAVRLFHWYHVALKADGCHITASAWAAEIGEIHTQTVSDPDCFRRGAIGLRSNGTGGVWRNIQAIPLGQGKRRGAGGPLPAEIEPARASLPQEETGSQSISSLQYLSPLGAPVASVRGTVVLTRPKLFLQDATGGVEVQAEGDEPLKIGDEVEATGEVSLEKFTPFFKRAQIRVLREAVPVSPLVLTSNQIATGAYDGRFVQVDGYLRGIATETDGAVTMEINTGSQSFHAILPPGRSRSHVEGLALESRLRLRGVSIVDRQFNKSSDPFVILVRSAEDIDVLAGPPWWRPSTLILVTLVVLGLIFTANHLYLLAKHWRLRAVADERERLAHEIHDTLAQSFAGIGFQLQAIRNSIPHEARFLEREVDRAMLMARTSHEEARRSIASLRPESLGQVGLLPALRQSAERMVKNGLVTVETSEDDGARVVPTRIKDTLFRIGQEAIANSIRHANPKTIRIRLQQHRASLYLSIEDDGDGFTADSDHAGFGLLGMHKRAESISATLLIRSAPGAGTRVDVRAPARSRFFDVAWRVRRVAGYGGLRRSS